jgi:hypothetical protein
MRVLCLVLVFFAWVCLAADDYSFRTRGAVDDLLYYQIGGGEAVMPPPCVTALRHLAWALAGTPI